MEFGHLPLEDPALFFGILELIEEPEDALAVLYVPPQSTAEAVADQSQIEESWAHRHLFGVETVSQIELPLLLVFLQERHREIVDSLLG